MNQQTEGLLKNLSKITEFAKQHAFNDAYELTPAEFVSDQFLRRCTHLAEDFSRLIRNGHDLNAAILQRAISERIAILGYLREHNQFKEFQDYSMAREYQALQHITSDEQTGHSARQAAEQRKAEIRRSMGGEPGKSADYWKRPTHRAALQSTSQCHPKANLIHITSYGIPSSAVHIRHNDAEPTGNSSPSRGRPSYVAYGSSHDIGFAHCEKRRRLAQTPAIDHAVIPRVTPPPEAISRRFTAPI